MAPSKWTPFKKFNAGDLLPPNIRQKFREWFVFVEATGTRQQNQSPEASQNYRYPAPVTQPKAKIPTISKERVYNTQFYTRDVSRNTPPLITQNNPQAQIEEPQVSPDAEKGSPGNKNPAVLAYDPTGTRSAMSTTHEATRNLINQEAKTSYHNVRYEWEPHMEEIIADCEEKGIPPVPGRPYPWTYDPESRVKAW